jgi:predicted  nucleic acid-binding Zn-ribbon protein
MHKCVRCSRIAASLAEIDAGCPCGSKVFVFGKDAAEMASQPIEAQPNSPAAMPITVPPQPEEAKTAEPDGKAPSSSYARMSFTSEDVENIKVVREGVFLLDVNALSRDPMVLKDEEGIYYVKLPFEQRKPQLNGKENDGNGNGGNGKK